MRRASSAAPTLGLIDQPGHPRPVRRRHRTGSHRRHECQIRRIPRVRRQGLPPRTRPAKTLSVPSGLRPPAAARITQRITVSWTSRRAPGCRRLPPPVIVPNSPWPGVPGHPARSSRLSGRAADQKAGCANELRHPQRINMKPSRPDVPGELANETDRFPDWIAASNPPCRPDPGGRTGQRW